MKEMVGGCCVCSDERGWTENPLVYCDGQGCTVAVHQACYGIVTVPTGPWFCRKCESQERAVRVRCELCPIRDGALKRTDTQAWAHVVCALYIPEVRFGNVSTMEPIILQLIPAERYNKSCYICEEQGKGSRATVGACMQCNKAGCKAQFHVTCAQGLGLLCEEAGNYMDNVKYCGYCQHHYSKLKKGGNVKQVPPYKPVANEMAADGDKEEGGRKRKGGSGGSSGKAGGRGGRGNTTPSPNLNKPGGGVSPSTAIESGEGAHVNAPTGNPGPNGTVAIKELLPPPTPTSTASVIKDPVLGAGQTTPTPQNHGTKFTTSNFVETVVTPSESVFGADQGGPKPTSNPSSNSGTGKKRRSAGGIRTPPGTVAPTQELVDSGSSAPASGTSSVNSGPSVVKMDVDRSPTQNAANYPPSDITSVEKGVKKLKVVSEPNLSALNNPGATSSPSLSTVDPVTKGNSAPATQSGSSVTSSANSIVVSVPLTAAVSLPSTQTSGGPIVTSASSHSASAPQPSSTETTHYISSSNGTTTTFTKAPVPSITHDIHSASKRSRSQSAEKQDKRKTKRGAPTPTNNAPASTSTVTSSTSSSVTSSAPSHPAPTVNITGTSSVPASTPSIVNNTTAAPVTVPSASSILAATAWPNKRGRVPNPTTPPPQVATPDNTTSSSLSKDSPPSSPEPAGPRGRRKSQKNHQSSSSGSSNSSVSQSTTAAGSAQPVYKERDVKLFQNGVTSVNAPHMLGNQLNPASSMAQKMSDTLSAELEAHSIFNTDSTGSAAQLIGPPLPSRVISSVRSSSTHSAESGSGSTGSTTNKTTPPVVVPQTLDQLLERQWEQGSQFLMEQAQHFDIASLLTCLHQLRTENTRLEEHIRKLQQRRDHLLAVNARLAIPLTSQTAALPAGPQAAGSAATNAVVTPSGQIAAQVAGHVDAPAVIPVAVPTLGMHVPAQVSNPVPSPSGAVQRSAQPPRSGYQAPLENGLPTDPNSHHPTYPQAHQRNPMERSHQSSAIRHAQPTGASYIMSQQTGSTNQGVGVVRSNQTPSDPGRRPGVGYVIYPSAPGGSVPPSGQFNVPSQQVVMRRDLH